MLTNKDIIKLDGNVSVIVNPNSILLTQKDGKIAIQGNCKQLHHLLRVEEYIERYINGESYESCLQPRNPEYLIEVKKGYHNLEEARKIGKESINHIDTICKKFVERPFETNEDIGALLEDVQYNMIKIAITKEIEGDNYEYHD